MKETQYARCAEDTTRSIRHCRGQTTKHISAQSAVQVSAKILTGILSKSYMEAVSSEAASFHAYVELINRDLFRAFEIVDSINELNRRILYNFHMGLC